MDHELTDDIDVGKFSLAVGPFLVHFTMPAAWVSKTIATWSSWQAREDSTSSNPRHVADVTIFAARNTEEISNNVELVSMSDAKSSWRWPTDPQYLKTPEFTDAWGQKADFRRHIDYSLRNILVEAGLEHGAILMHAATVVLEGKAYIAPGKSGRGKTTLFKLLGGYDANHLHEDLAFLMDGYAYSLPCKSSHTHWRTPSPQRAPVGGFIDLGRTPDVACSEIENRAERLRIISSALVPPLARSDASQHYRLLELCEALSAKYQCFALSFPNDARLGQRLERALIETL